MTGAARATGLDIPSTDEHAGALETSQALAFFPELVGDHASVQGFVDALDGWEEELFEQGIQVLSDQGVLGDPQAAIATAGHAINTALSQMLADWVREELKCRQRRRQIKALRSNQESVLPDRAEVHRRRR